MQLTFSRGATDDVMRRLMLHYAYALQVENCVVKVVFVPLFSCCCIFYTVLDFLLYFFTSSSVFKYIIPKLLPAGPTAALSPLISCF